VTRWLAAVAAVAVAVSLALIGALHVLPPSDRISPVRRTISEYALHANGGLFDAAVLLLAAASFTVLLALVRAGLVRAGSAGAFGLLLWCGGLAAVVYFEKHNWAVGPSAHGTIHRYAGVVAFLSLPVAALLIGRAWWADPRWRGLARWTCGLGALALLCFAPIAVAYAIAPLTGVPWWRAIPLGAVERALGAVEVAIVVLLAWWAARAGAPAHRPARPPASSRAG
jgi:hypothetical protein